MVDSGASSQMINDIIGFRNKKKMNAQIKSVAENSSTQQLKEIYIKRTL